MRKLIRIDDTNHIHEYSPACPVSKGAQKALSLEQLQKDARKQLGLHHLTMGMIGYLAEASGRESVDELARVLNITTDNVQAHERYIRKKLIPNLQSYLSASAKPESRPVSRTHHHY